MNLVLAAVLAALFLGAHSAPARERRGASGPPRATESGFGAEPRLVQETAEAPRITPQEFKKLYSSSSVVIVDTRRADAFAAGHIPGALLLPLEGQLTWPEEYQKSVVEKLKRAKKPIVTYCA